VTKIPAGAGGIVRRYSYRPRHQPLWLEVERVLGASDFASRRRVRRDIRAAILRFKGSAGAWWQAPRPRDARDKLDAVQKAADALDVALARLTDTERHLMRAGPGGRHWRHDSSGFREPVMDIRRLAGSAIARLPTDGGGAKVADVPFINMVARLHATYSRETGGPPVVVSIDRNKGNICDFVSLVDSVIKLSCDVIDHDAPDRDPDLTRAAAFTKEVQRALAVPQPSGT
jgi:hypothetical protein